MESQGKHLFVFARPLDRTFVRIYDTDKNKCSHERGGIMGMNGAQVYLSLNHINVKTHKTESRSRKRKHFSLMLFAFLCVLGFIHAIGGSVSAATRMQRYVVQQGDTVWSIALHQVPGSDPRQVVDRIELVNHLSATDEIQPNQVLRIPAEN